MVRRGSEWCGVAQLVVRRLAVRHHREVFPTELISDEEMEMGLGERRRINVWYECMYVLKYEKLVGFSRACAPVRCAHPSFWALCHAQRGAARPSAHRSFAAPPKQKITISRNKMSPSRPKLGPPVAYIFPLG
jgi:hypothetical protein